MNGRRRGRLLFGIGAAITAVGSLIIEVSVLLLLTPVNRAALERSVIWGIVVALAGVVLLLTAHFTSNRGNPGK